MTNTNHIRAIQCTCPPRYEGDHVEHDLDPQCPVHVGRRSASATLERVAEEIWRVDEAGWRFVGTADWLT